MSTYLLIPGAGGVAWYWHRLAPLLDRAIAVDLPGDDPSQGLPEYVELVVEAAAGETDLVVVAQSLGAFTAVPACARLDVRHLFLLNAMIPAPGRPRASGGRPRGSEAARIAAARAGGYTEEFDVDAYFLHDVDPEILATGEARPEADAVFETPCDCTVWPPTTVLSGVDDRFFPLEFQRRVAQERLGRNVVEVPGGHLAALDQPEAEVEAARSSASCAA